MESDSRNYVIESQETLVLRFSTPRDVLEGHATMI